jgi:hypothetical protein
MNFLFPISVKNTGLKKVPYQLYEKNSFNVKFMHTCTKKLFLGRVNDK